MVIVQGQKRPAGSKPNALRREGLIPAVLYGHKGAQSDSLVLKQKDVELLLKEASVNNTLVELQVTDAWSGQALIREVQVHPWRRHVYHLSFFSVAAQDTVEVSVPLNLVGEAAGVKEGGVLEQTITEMTVQCPPDSIPETIDIDISNMEVGTTLHVRELALPAGVAVMDDPESAIFSIVPPGGGAGAEAAATEEAEVALETDTEPAEPKTAPEASAPAEE
ncbi:MAG: 50S ribosomal protein L25/general stress protein Ctc [Cyanophyceae cyanobacterium]